MGHFGKEKGHAEKTHKAFIYQWYQRPDSNRHDLAVGRF